MKALTDNAEFISKTFEQEELEGNFNRVSPSVSGVILPELSFDPENSTNNRIIFTEQVYEGDTISCVYGSEIIEIKLPSIIVDGDSYIAYVGLVNQVGAPSKIYSGIVPRTTVFSGNTRNSTVTDPIEAEVVDSTTNTATIRITNKGEQTLDSNSIVVLDNEETVATVLGMVESEVVISGKDILQPLGLPITSIFSNPTAASVDSNGGSRFFLGGYVYTKTERTRLYVYFLNRPFDTRSISESYTFNYSDIIGFNNSTDELVVGGGFSPNGKYFYAIFHAARNSSIKVGTLVLNEPFYLNKGFTKHEHPKLSITVNAPYAAGQINDPSIHVAPDCSRAYLLFTARTSSSSPYYPITSTYELEINTADYLFDDTVTPYRIDESNYQQFKGVGFCGVSQELVISISNTNHTNNNTPTYVVTTIGVKGLTNYSLKSINAKISTLYTKRDLHSVISEEIVSEASAAHTYFRIFGETKEGQVVLNSTNSVEGLYKYYPVNNNKDFSISFSTKSTAPTSCMILPKTSSLLVTYDVGGSKTILTISSSSTLFNNEIVTADTLEAGQTCLFNRHARSVIPTLLGNPKYVLEEKLREYVINGEVESIYGTTDLKSVVNIYGLTPINAEGTKFIGGYSAALFWFEVEKAYDFSTIKNITNDNLIARNNKYFNGVTTLTTNRYASFIVSSDYLKIEVLNSSRQIGTINLTTPADFSTAKWTTFSSSTSISSALLDATGFQLSADGTKAYAYRSNITASDGTNIKGIQEYTLGTPYNLMSMTVSDKSLYDLPAYRVSTNSYFSTFCWNSDGTVGLAIFRNGSRANQLDVVVFKATTDFDLDSLNEIQRIESLDNNVNSLLQSLRVREDGVEEFIFTNSGNNATVLELAPHNHYKLDHDELPEVPSYCTIVKEGEVVKPQFASEGAEGLVITYPEHSLEPNTRALALKTVANKKATIGSINCEIWKAN